MLFAIFYQTLLILMLVSCTGNPQVIEHVEPPFDVQEYMADFTRGSSHEANPFGVPPSWSWSRTASGDEWTHLFPLYGEDHSNFWLEVYPYETEEIPENLRVAVINHVYLGLIEGETDWRVIQQEDELNGRYYDYLYQQDRGPILDIRLEEDGSESFALLPGGNAHLWPRSGVVEIASHGTLLAACYIVHARLISDNSSSPDGLTESQLVLAGGMDWKYSNGLGPEELGYCDAIHHGKFMVLQEDWRAYVATTMTAEELEGYPAIPKEYFLLPHGSFPNYNGGTNGLHRGNNEDNRSEGNP